MFYILRRRGLGNTTTKAIQQYSQQPITIIRNDKSLLFSPSDTILRWGCTSQVQGNPHVLNKAISIDIVGNKRDFRAQLQINHPEIIPKTWFNHTDPYITYPCIIRPQHHAQGKNLVYCEQRNNLVETLLNQPALCINGYISEYIPKVAEYRVCFIQGRVAWVARKIPKDPQTIAWNVAQGGKFENVRWKDWPIDVIETAYKAYKLSTLYISGVDIMVDNDGKSYVLEANSAPSHTSPYRQACTAKCIAYGITNDDFTHIPPDDNFKKYSKWLHPALKNV